MTHYIVSAHDPEDLGMPVAEVEVDAKSEREAIDKAKVLFKKQLTTLDGLTFTALGLDDDKAE
jgi:hypothetical protein